MASHPAITSDARIGGNRIGYYPGYLYTTPSEQLHVAPPSYSYMACHSCGHAGSTPKAYDSHRSQARNVRRRVPPPSWHRGKTKCLLYQYPWSLLTDQGLAEK